MSKKLAIKGHETRGKEIIELLEMMGGINKNILSAHIGDVLNPHVYFLEPDSSDNRIVWNYLLGLEWDGRASDMMIFTLEEFLEKYPYKLNELVLCDDGLLGIITKMEWDCEKSDMKYYISFKISDYNKWYSSKNIKCAFMEVKGKKLAIKGHSTRGKEVIELLEMLGGKNTYRYNGDMESLYFSIYNDTIIYGSYRSFLNDNYVFFTLEEFLDKYPFKAGDKVYIEVDPNDNCLGSEKIYGDIESAMWVEKFGYVVYKLKDYSGIFYREDLHPYKEESMEDNKLFGTLSNPVETKSYAVGLKDGKVIECGVNKEIVMSDKNHKMGPKSKLPSKYYKDRLEEIKSKREYDELRMPLNDNENKFPSFKLMFKMNDELEYKVPDGYEITEVSKDTVFIKPIKPKYPKTYAECCEYLMGKTNFAEYSLIPIKLSSSTKYDNVISPDAPHMNVINSFYKLLICCDAYWKIAGEEMGLDKPWKPDWNEETNKFTISNKCNKIYLNNTAWYAEVLSFPTAEMRDAFYENFKDLIEQCKELL